MKEKLSYAEALDSNRNRREPGKLSHIEVSHHMSDGSAEMVRIEPGKMSEHLADCEHCGGSTTAAG